MMEDAVINKKAEGRKGPGAEKVDSVPASGLCKGTDRSSDVNHSWGASRPYIRNLVDCWNTFPLWVLGLDGQSLRNA